MGGGCGRYVGGGDTELGGDTRERERYCKMKVLQDIARRRYCRILQDESTAGHCKTKVLEDNARRRYCRTLKDEGTAGH